MRKFKAESKKLLDLMVNSIYTNKEIFLRELISNASDALDKLYLRSLSEGDNSITRGELGIEVSFDKEARTITVTDNGIGMTAEELEKNLGTIAHSGSLEFKEDGGEAEGSDEVDIIGQFGVGFYSAFMVADDVKVVTKAYGSDEASVWQSNGLEGYTIVEGEREGRGTDIIMKLREDTDADDYSRWLNQKALERLIVRYSNYVRYPIRMEVEKQRQLPKPEDAGDDYKPEYETYTEIETINSMVPVWTKRKQDVAEGEYEDFYKSEFHDHEGPLRTISMHAEGTLTYDALLYIPTRPPYDFYDPKFERGLKLYSSSVMVMERCPDLLPSCFGFVRGVVDSKDLSLNISREMLQHDRQLQAIERRIEKKVKSELADMRDNDREAYVDFFGQFGHAFKYAIYSSYGAKSELLSDLLLFYSAREDKPITLDEYNAAAAEDQKSIYYAFGDSVANLAKMPTVKAVLDKGYDVLLCADNVDEFCLMTLGTYGEKDMRNVSGGELGLETEEEKEAAQKANTENADLFEAMKDALGEKVTKVVASTRLTDAAACITSDSPMSLGMEKYLMNMPSNEETGMTARHVLEINPDHPLFETLRKAQEDKDEDKVSRYATLLYDQALLAEGMPIDDTAAFNSAICELMR